MAETTNIGWCDGTLKRCTICKSQKPLSDFNRDKSRGDGLAAKCRSCNYTRITRPHRKPINPDTGRPGPSPKPGRDGDKFQARARVNAEVNGGRMPAPNRLPCFDCGHLWVRGGSRHEYDHHNGYGAEHQLDVQVVCKPCHVKRDNLKAAQTHCVHGHEFTELNTGHKRNGTRFCRMCRMESEKRRSPRGKEYWREVNAARKEKSYGKRH